MMKDGEMESDDHQINIRDSLNTQMSKKYFNIEIVRKYWNDLTVRLYSIYS